MTQVRNQRLDSRVASTMAYVASALLKALEIEDLESRLAELESNNDCAKHNEKD